MKGLRCLLTDDALPGILAMVSVIQAVATCWKVSTCKVLAGAAFVCWVYKVCPFAGLC